jgi:K+-sensing histidine kinase KdpD
MLETYQGNGSHESSGFLDSPELDIDPDQRQLPLWKIIEICAIDVSFSDDFVSKQLWFELDINSSSIIVDKEACEILLSPLLKNAARNSPRGGRISIGCSKAASSFEVSVSHEGQPGLPVTQRFRCS